MQETKLKAVNSVNFKQKFKEFKPKSLRAQLLGIIHCHAVYKQIHAANAWEEWLFLRYGENSCKALNERELGDVIDLLDGKIPDRDYVLRMGTATQAQQRKIYAIMRAKGWGERAKNAFITRQIGTYKPTYLMTKEEATKVITGLQAF